MQKQMYAISGKVLFAFNLASASRYNKGKILIYLKHWNSRPKVNKTSMEVFTLGKSVSMPDSSF